MLRRHVPHSKKDKTGQECRQQLVSRETAEIYHEAENAGKRSALFFAEPGAVNLDEAGRTERLQVTVQTPEQGEEP